MCTYRRSTVKKHSVEKIAFVLSLMVLCCSGATAPDPISLCTIDKAKVYQGDTLHFVDSSSCDQLRIECRSMDSIGSSQVWMQFVGDSVGYFGPDSLFSTALGLSYTSQEISDRARGINKLTRISMVFNIRPGTYSIQKTLWTHVYNDKSKFECHEVPGDSKELRVVDTVLVLPR